MAAEKRPTAPHRGTDVAGGQHLSIEEKYDEVRQLINIGKEKGYLLYDEVNELLPSEITSSDELDDLFNTFGSAGIEVIDSDQKYLRDDEADRPDGRRRRGARARPHARRARQDQRPGPHVPARDGHRAAAHARGRSRDRAPHRARQARRHQVDLAHAARRQEGHRARRPAARRRPHDPRAGDLQRRGDHRRAHRRALASRCRSRSTPCARRARSSEKLDEKLARDAEGRDDARQAEVPQGRWAAMRARDRAVAATSARSSSPRR